MLVSLVPVRRLKNNLGPVARLGNLASRSTTALVQKEKNPIIVKSENMFTFQLTTIPTPSPAGEVSQTDVGVFSPIIVKSENMLTFQLTTIPTPSPAGEVSQTDVGVFSPIIVKSENMLTFQLTTIPTPSPAGEVS